MIKSIFKNTLLLLIALISFDATSQVRGQGTVESVIDGDTFDVTTTPLLIKNLLQSGVVSKKHVSENTFRIRLANVDTAESNHYNDNRNSQKGLNSKEYVKSILENKKVSFTCYKSGHYGRAICSITTKEIGDLGIHLIKNNHSKYITKYGKHPEYHRNYLIADKLRHKEKVKPLKEKATHLINQYF